MDTDRQIAVRMTLSAVPEFLPLVQGVVDRLAEHREFAESQRLQLKQGIQQAARHLLLGGGEGEAAEMSLEVAGYADRVEIVVEAEKDLGTSEADLYLLNELLDRVA
ncbi:MAG: hypothetical protein ACRD4D_06225, partial [Candidatus Acidiferrales bacterium]